MRCKIDFGSLLGRTNNMNNAPGRHGRHLPATMGIKLRGTGGKGPARGSTSFKSGILSVEWDTTWALDCHGWISPELSLLWLWEHCLHSSSQNMFPPFLYWIHIGRCQTKSRCCQVTNFRERKLLIVGLALFEYFPELKRWCEYEFFSCLSFRGGEQKRGNMASLTKARPKCRHWDRRHLQVCLWITNLSKHHYFGNKKINNELSIVGSNDTPPRSRFPKRV